MYEELKKVLPIGKDNAKHLDVISAHLHKSSAAVKVLIREARRSGEIILSGHNGYWIPADNEAGEIDSFITSMRKHAITQLESISKMKAVSDMIPGQESLLKELERGENEQIHN